MSLTGRPSSPPLALSSSAQICLDIRWALPEEASPPVSETLKPILIGSPVCARQTVGDAIAASAMTIARAHVFRALFTIRRFMASSPGRRLLFFITNVVGRHDSTGLTDARKPTAHLVPRLAFEPRSRPPREPIIMLTVLIRDGA